MTEPTTVEPPAPSLPAGPTAAQDTSSRAVAEPKCQYVRSVDTTVHGGQFGSAGKATPIFAMARTKASSRVASGKLRRSASSRYAAS